MKGKTYLFFTELFHAFRTVSAQAGDESSGTPISRAGGILVLLNRQTRHVHPTLGLIERQATGKIEAVLSERLDEQPVPIGWADRFSPGQSLVGIFDDVGQAKCLARTMRSSPWLDGSKTTIAPLARNQAAISIALREHRSKKKTSRPRHFANYLSHIAHGDRAESRQVVTADWAFE